MRILGIVIFLCFYSASSYAGPTVYGTACSKTASGLHNNCNINVSSLASNEQIIVENGGSVELHKFLYCKVVTNTTGRDVFIPAKKLSERLANVGGTTGIVFSDC